jgi:hypothetical protein
MDIPEIALLNSLRTMNEATQGWKDDNSKLHGFADGWKTCLTTLLRVYGSDETIKKLAGLAVAESVRADQLIPIRTEQQVATVGSASQERIA